MIARFCDTLDLDPETKWWSFCDDAGTAKPHQFLRVRATGLLLILQYTQDITQDIRYQGYSQKRMSILILMWHLNITIR